MNTITKISTAIAVAGLATLGAAIPAQAFSISTVNDGTFGTFTLGDTTTLNFEFIRSHGQFKSTLSIADLLENILAPALFAEGANGLGYDNGSNTANDWLGTCGNVGSTVANCKTSKTLNAGSYQFALESTINNAARPTVFSEGNFAGGNGDGLAGGVQITSLGTNKYKISFDDGGNNNDKDFNDFIISAEVPEPVTILGTLTALGAGYVMKRRQKQQASKSA